MRIGVTGGCGFIGSHVVEALLGRGHQVRVLSRPTCGEENIKGLPLERYRCDIRDGAAVYPLVDELEKGLLSIKNSF